MIVGKVGFPPIVVIGILLAMSEAAVAQSEDWKRIPIGGAPVEALAATEDGTAIAIVGLSGLYLSLDGGTTWTRDNRVDPLQMECGAMDVKFKLGGVIRFRCVEPGPAKTRCLLLPFPSDGTGPCSPEDITAKPRPGRKAHRVVFAFEQGIRERLGLFAGTRMPVLFGPGLDGLAAVNIEPDVSGKETAVFVDFAAPLVKFLTHEADPWARAGRARCVRHRDGWACTWLKKYKNRRKIGATPIPKTYRRSFPSGVPRPIFDLYPDIFRKKEGPFELAASPRGLFTK